MSRNSQRPVRTVCFTGHRLINPTHVPMLGGALERAICRLMERGATVFRAGGAKGFDTVAALMVLELREKHPEIRLELILPFRGQQDKWDDEDVYIYDYILARADRVEYLYEQYVDGCMLARNRRLLEGSDVCVAYCTRSTGGTAYTCRKAQQTGVELINLLDTL